MSTCTCDSFCLSHIAIQFNVFVRKVQTLSCCRVFWRSETKGTCRLQAVLDHMNSHGIPVPQCAKSCDFCENPTAAKERAKSAQICHVGHKYGSRMGASFRNGRVDPSLYGGGKWGYKR